MVTFFIILSFIFLGLSIFSWLEDMWPGNTSWTTRILFLCTILLTGTTIYLVNN